MKIFIKLLLVVIALSALASCTSKILVKNCENVGSSGSGSVYSCEEM